MIEPTTASRPSVSGDPAFADLIEELTAQFQRGEPVDEDACLRDHPDYADQLRQLLPALRLLANASRSGDSAAPVDGADPLAGCLGDFRILREVGRGGMGVVYEAEQISLGRRVALKVLPFAATMDPRHLQRFQNEARAAASLEHPHIVPVYGVGCERGVHYYAMKFIDGQTVAALIADQRQDSESAQQPTQTFTGATSRPNTTPRAQDTTACAPRDAAYFRRAAEWGIRAAEALEHAHSLGIVHRDIKPGNLMIDGSGTLWVADFGLARTAADSGMTMTGDLMGTLRYMSPEQAQAKHGLVDHRTDVYSLGATLYELLTLQPVVQGEDRAALLQKIASDDPILPRKLNKAIPPELEIIVLKAMEKKPEDRFTTAQQMSDDLRRFLEDKPIQARRPAAVQRAKKWLQRHRSVVGAAGAGLVLAVVALAVSTVAIVVAYREELSQRQKAEHQEQLARDAQAQEAEQRQVVEKQRDAARYQLYIADMRLARDAIEMANLARCQLLLEKHRPETSERDLRGWEWYFLQHLCHLDLLTVETDFEEVQSMAWSPDGKLLAAAGAQTKTITIIEAESGKQKVLVPGPKKGSLGSSNLSWSPDSKRLAWADHSNRTAVIWDIAAGCEVVTLPQHDQETESISWNPDGNRLATTHQGADSPIKIWEATTGKELRSIPLKGGPALALAWSPDGTHLAAGGEIVRAWDLASGEQTDLTADANGDGLAFKVAWSPDGKRLAVSHPTIVKVWEMAKRKEVLSVPGAVNVAWSPDGTRLTAPSSVDRLAIKIWDADNGKELFTLWGHTGKSDRARCVVWSPNGQRIASSAGEVIKIWDATSQQVYLALQGHTKPACSVGWDRNGERVASASVDGSLKVWELATGNVLLNLTTVAPAGTFAWSPDGRHLATTAVDRIETRLWDAATGKEIQVLRGSRKEDETRQGHTFGVRGAGLVRLAWSPDGKRLASSYNDMTIRIWDLVAGQEVATLPAPMMTHLAWSPDGLWVAIGAPLNGGISIWDTGTWQQPILFSDPEHGRALAWSPDSQLLASAGMDGITKVWSLATHEEAFSLNGHAAAITALAWNSDGNRLASASEDGTVKLWELETRQDVLTLPAQALALAWSPDGRRLAIAGNNLESVVQVWDNSAGHEVPKPRPVTTASQQIDLVTVSIRLADSLHRNAQYLEAEKALGNAQALQEGLAARFPYEPWYRQGLVEIRLRMVDLFLAAGRFQEAQQGYRHVLELQESLEGDTPELRLRFENRTRTYLQLGILLEHLGRYSEASDAFRQGLNLYTILFAGLQDNTKIDLENNLAWLLATCPEPQHADPQDALRLAKQYSPKEQPSAPDFFAIYADLLTTLGTAYYSVGDWKDAVTTLNTASQYYAKRQAPVCHEREGITLFFLSMAHCQLGEKDEARDSYDRAVQWMEKYKVLYGQLDHLHPDLRHELTGKDVERYRKKIEEMLGLKITEESP